MLETGTIQYTERAFEQDADLAMSNDIMRALVELVTNADDAYAADNGQITVTVDRVTQSYPIVSVRDTARGLAPQDLKKCFSVLGGKDSGFHEGEDVRGLFGRGAKDTAAFGRTIFESIQDGGCGKFILERSGAWTLEDAVATEEHYQELSIPVGGSGLVATICVLKDGVSIPNRQRLIERLERHIQLRRINMTRELVVIERRAAGPVQSAVARWAAPQTSTLADVEIQINGYEQPARLFLGKLSSPSDGSVNDYSRHGLEIRGRKATYSNTLFGERGPETAWIHGFVECPQIDDLLRSYDDDRGNDPQNPTRLVRRDRIGLSEDHPYSVALTQAVLRVLSPILEDLKPKASGVSGGTKLRKDLDSASAALSALVRSDLESIDDETSGGGLTPSSVSPIIVIPGGLSLRVGKSRKLTLHLSDELVEGSSELRASVQDPSVIRVGSFGDLHKHINLPDTWVTSIEVAAEHLGNTVLTIKHAESGNSASARVRVHDDESTEPDPPLDLCWKNSSMSVAHGKSRTIELIAPAEMAPAGALRCSVEIDGDAVSLGSGSVDLEINQAGWLSGRLQIEGIREGESVAVVASTGTDQAVGRIRVTRPSALDGLGIRIEIIDEARGRTRGSMRTADSGHVVEVCAGHNAIRGLLGDRRDDGSFENEESREARLVVTEIVAAIVADWLVGKEAQRYPQEFADADAVLGRRNNYLDRYINPLQRALASQTS